MFSAVKVENPKETKDRIRDTRLVRMMDKNEQETKEKMEKHRTFLALVYMSYHC